MERRGQSVADSQYIDQRDNSIRIRNQTAHSDTDPWSKLVALKQRLKPTQEAQSFNVERRYHQLAKGPKNQNVEAWLNDWTDMYHEAMRLKIFEVSEGRGIRDFLNAIHTVDAAYANGRKNYRAGIEEQISESAVPTVRQRTMDEEIEKFRNQYRTLHTSHVRDITSLATHTPSFKGKDQNGKNTKPPCICGGNMFYSDCWYLFPSKAPAGWKADPDVKKKVDDAMMDPKTKERVMRSADRAKQYASNTPSTSNTESSSSRTPIITTTAPPITEAPEALATTFNRVSLTSFYSNLNNNTAGLESFLIHDGGSNVHVCNKYSKHLFIESRDAHDEFLSGGTSGAKIECWGELYTAFDSPAGKIPVVLQNVAYVGSYLTSIVSGIVLDKKNIHTNSRGPHLFDDDPHKVKFQLYKIREKYTFTPTGVPYIDLPTKSTPAVATATVLTSKPATVPATAFAAEIIQSQESKDSPDMHLQSTSKSSHEAYAITERMRKALLDLDAEDHEEPYDDLLYDDLLNTLHITPPLNETAKSSAAETLPPFNALPSPSATPGTITQQQEDRDNNINRRSQEEDLGLRRIEEETQGDQTQRKGPKNPTSSTGSEPKTRGITAGLDSSNVLPEGEKRHRRLTRAQNSMELMEKNLNDFKTVRKRLDNY